MVKNISEEAAEILIDLKCINFSPKKQFKLTSGKKSPVYCDCRRIISFPEERENWEQFKEKLETQPYLAGPLAIRPKRNSCVLFRVGSAHFVNPVRDAQPGCRAVITGWPFANMGWKDKYYFDNLNIKLPDDFDVSNYEELKIFLKDLKGEIYSINAVSEILDKIDLISINEQYEAVKATVSENILSNKINLSFNIEETERFIVERINIYGNDITRESVIRNNLTVDEGDIYNELLTKKSENNLKSLGIFGNVKSTVIEGSNNKSKIIEIEIEEKATGEIMAGAGFSSQGASFAIGVRENNYLGRGIKFDSDLFLSTDSIKGQIGITNPNFRNTNKSLSLN